MHERFSFVSIRDIMNLSCFFTHVNYTQISLFCDDTLIRWKAGCSISILFVDFSAKPMPKSPAQISLKDEHYKLPPTSLQSLTGKLL